MGEGAREEEHHRSSEDGGGGRRARRTWGREEGDGKRWVILRAIDNYWNNKAPNGTSTLKPTNPCPWSLTWPW